MKRLLLFIFLIVSVSTEAADAGKNFMNCGTGDYILSYPPTDNDFVYVNGSRPSNQTVKYLGDPGDSRRMLVTWPFTRNLMLQWEKLPTRQRLYVYDYPDGVHPRLIEKNDCIWIKRK